MGDKSDITPELEETLSELDLLRRSLEEQKQKGAEYYDQLLRLRAEFENFRRRAEREKSEARAWGKQDVLVELVSLLDVFQQAMHQAEKARDLKQVIEGLQMLHRSFSQFLKIEGLEPIQAVGKPFDPQLEEAIEQLEVDEEKVGMVLDELQTGYLFQGKVLRPSRVRVGVQKKGAVTTGDDE
jgi:molecular chaperone GrpE